MNTTPIEDIGASDKDDPVGKKFGMLTVLEVVPNKSGLRIKWKCRCDCGNESLIPANRVRYRLVKSCGCHVAERKRLCALLGFGIERGAQAHQAVADGKERQKMTDHPIYMVWIQMRRRCKDPRSQSYKDYGARGITVCDQWDRSFPQFVCDMGAEWRPGLSLDRREVNGNYEPSNCRWATRREQSMNQRRSVKFVIDGVERNLVDLLRMYNKASSTFYVRIQRGMSPADALKVGYIPGPFEPGYINYKAEYCENGAHI